MNMFKDTSAKTPKEYIDLIDEPRRTDIKKLHLFVTKNFPKLKPFILSGMIGYGKFHYKYKSGREGEWSVLALASQKNYISFYVCIPDGEGYIPERFKKDLPKASIGKSCIRFKKLEDIDINVLKKIIDLSAKAKNPYTSL